MMDGNNKFGQFNSDLLLPYDLLCLVLHSFSEWKVISKVR